MIINFRSIFSLLKKKIKSDNNCFKISYSQEGEDLILDRIFNSKKNGFYIDIGAHDPFRFSNTFLFYKMNWHGINIDAIPGTKKKFDKYRKRDINLEIGVSDNKSQLEYYNFQEKALNTFDKDLANQYINLKWELQGIIKINTETLNTILNREMPLNTAIDFMSIDIEGFEYKVLTSNDWNKFRPKILLIEILDFNIERYMDNPISSFLYNKGYKIIAKTKNTIFFEDIN
jgi:FkbM family methyltransferase